MGGSARQDASGRRCEPDAPGSLSHCPVRDEPRQARVARLDAEQMGITVVVEEAKQHIASLKPRVPTLLLHLPSDVGDPNVVLDDHPITSAVIGVPIPLDPGSHRVVVAAPGRVSFTRTIRMKEGKSLDLEVALDAAPATVASSTAAPAPASATPVAASALPVAADASLPKQGEKSARTAGFVLVGVGGAAILAAGVFQLLRSSAIGDIDERCPSHTDCDPGLRDTRDKAVRYATMSGVAAGLGVVLAGTGAYFLLTSRGAAEKGGASVAVVPAVWQGGAQMTGVVRW
jgi:hypothetical protein